jgi:tRNA(Arg) A34 adenosine deaminase TadA
MLPPLASAFALSVPEWVHETMGLSQSALATDDERMALTIELSRLNMSRGGGPFAALVFAGSRCVGAGVNRVVASGYSIAHAEILALMSAQCTLRDLPLDAPPSLTLYTTTEPCCQCYGALFWSGLTRLVCAATTTDAEAIGFDEGPKPTDWIAELETRNIAVCREILRQDARDVLLAYQARGGEIYGQSRPR